MKTGKMEWGEKASEGTKKGHEDPIELEGEYPIHWEEYSKLDGTYGTFHILWNKIEGES